MITNTYTITKLPLASIIMANKVNINTYISSYKLLSLINNSSNQTYGKIQYYNKNQQQNNYVSMYFTNLSLVKETFQQYNSRYNRLIVWIYNIRMMWIRQISESVQRWRQTNTRRGPNDIQKREGQTKPIPKLDSKGDQYDKRQCLTSKTIHVSTWSQPGIPG